jgi:hypothetical protein
MTTVTFKDGVLAADRRTAAEIPDGTSDPDRIIYDNSARKISRVECIDGTVRFVAVSGVASYLGQVSRWVSGGMLGEHPAPGESTAIIFSSPGRLLVVTDEGIEEFDIADFAISSGAAFALGAMSAGASAIEAIKIAAKYDAYTGSHVNFVTLDVDGIQYQE